MNKNFAAFFLFGLLILLFWGNYLLFKPFLVSIVLALVISQLFKKQFQKLNLCLGHRPSLASLLLCLVIFIFLFLPLLGIAYLTAAEISNFYEKIQSENWLENLSVFTRSLTADNYLNGPEQVAAPWQITPEKIASLQKTLGNYLFATIKIFYQSASHFVFMSFVMFFSLYYFFKDGNLFLQKIKKISPLKDAQEEKIFINFINIARATLKGSFVLAIIQGATLGLAFWLLGISSPIFWALLTAFFSLIPFIGTAAVWLPVGIFLLIEGSYFQAGAVILLGLVVISNIDNLLRPLLVGKDSGLHPLLVFFSTLGGIAIFGLSGFFIGPIITALLLSVLEIYQNEFKTELDNFNHPKQ